MTERCTPALDALPYMNLVDMKLMPAIDAFATRSSHFPDLIKAATALCLCRDLLLEGLDPGVVRAYADAIAEAAERTAAGNLGEIHGHLPSNVVAIDRNL